MVELSRQTLFLCSLVLIYIFLNTCRRLLVATAPSLISENKLTQNGYGFLSSLSSVEFGVCRFLAYQVLDHVPIDKYMCFFSILTCILCGVMSVISPENLQVDPQLFYCVCFGILFICLGLPFPCSSMVVRQYIAPNCERCGSLLISRSQFHLVVDSDQFVRGFDRGDESRLLCSKSLQVFPVGRSNWAWLHRVLLCVLPHNSLSEGGKGSQADAAKLSLAHSRVFMHSPLHFHLFSGSIRPFR